MIADVILHSPTDMLSIKMMFPKISMIGIVDVSALNFSAWLFTHLVKVRVMDQNTAKSSVHTAAPLAALYNAGSSKPCR